MARVELGEGVVAPCKLAAAVAAPVEEVKQAGALDLSSLSSMLNAKWKGGASASVAKPEALKAGQVRSFKITAIDLEGKRVELELA
jgi:small subunit ribosomal protein S1